MTLLDSVSTDLLAKSAALEEILTGLSKSDWAVRTPASGWTVAHQVAHLAWTDDLALLATTDETAFGAAMRVAAADTGGYVAAAAAEGARQDPAELLARWSASRAALTTALRGVPAPEKVPWFYRSMSATSMATARLMETWAHGQDIADAFGIRRAPTARLVHVAHIGVRTRDFAFHTRGMTPPAAEFLVELSAPDGGSWTWGPPEASERVNGPALDFCMLVTQRRHRDDTVLVVTGAQAQGWLDIAQAFAGPPGTGRTPGQFA